MIFGIPFSVWVSHNLGTLIVNKTGLSDIMSALVFVYVFFLGLNVFRSIFAYARWAFPKIELVDSNSSIGAHRLALAGISFSLVATMLYDLVKSFLL
jgi:hypothetical protein